MELLRIICMLMIVFHHFVYHALYADIFENGSVPQTLDDKLLLFWHSAFYIGVNCFILISGWFTIKTKLKGFVKLYLCLSFYKCLAVFRMLFLGGGEYTVFQSVIYIIRYTFMPFSTGRDFWFIDCYLLLMLIAPVLNIVIHLPEKKLLYSVTLSMFVYCIYTGIMGKAYVDGDGYCATHFIMMYLVGASLRFGLEDRKLRFSRWTLLVIYIVSSVCWGVATFLCLSLTGSITAKYWQPFAYNNIFVLINAICFSLFVGSFHFKNYLINSVAKSTLAVYIIQECGLIEYSWFVKPSQSPLANIAYLIALSIGFFMVAILIDKLRMEVFASLYKKAYNLADKIQILTTRE